MLTAVALKKLRCIEALYRHADNVYGESSLDSVA
ncbi:hypothetical protein LMG26854_02779 [Achromobacter aegrifaciens]|nr:hypothetical protein LMG26854_02779 [Achromobacter aegrifaciens]